MHAILKISGKQFKVTENQYLITPKLKEKEGEVVNFDKVLLYTDGTGNIDVGSPVLTNVQVSGKVDKHFLDKKILVFKKKRRKGYKKAQGHREALCRVLIEKIVKN